MSSMSPTAFISYSWDSDEHRAWVRALAQRLRDGGVDVRLDQWDMAPGDQLTEFMERGIRDHDFVVIICTPKYRRRSDSREGGVGYEGDVMTAEVMTERNHRKFIPVWRSGTWEDAAPAWLVGKYRIDLTGDPYSEQEYADLLVTLLGERPQAPPVAGGPPARQASTPRGQPSAEVSRGRPSASSAFEDIRITRVIVEDVTEPRNDGTAGSALYTVPFQLSATPPGEWRSLFIRHWNHPPRFTTMHRPGIARMSRDRVLLEGTTIEEVKQYHRDTLILAVDEANREYRAQIAEARRKQRAAEERKAQHRRNVDDVAAEIRFD